MSDSDESDDEQQSVQPSVFYSRYTTIEAPVLQQIAASPAAHAVASASASAGPRHSEHRCCLFNTAELVYQKRWTGADGCDIVLQPFAKHSANSDAAVALFKSTLAEVGIHANVAAPSPHRLVVSSAAVVPVADARPMVALLPWSLVCVPHKRPPPGSRFRELPANADRLAATLEAEVEALLADQRSLLDSMQRARVRAQAHQDTLDAAPTETALRALNEARAAVVAILDRLRSLMPATPSSVSASVSAPSAPAQESPTVAAISSSAAVVPGATDARRFCARVRVEQCTLCERVLAITDRGAQNASSASASGSSGATNVQSLIARVESLRIKVAALDGGAVDKAKRKKMQRKLKKLEEEAATAAASSSPSSAK